VTVPQANYIGIGIAIAIGIISGSNGNALIMGKNTLMGCLSGLSARTWSFYICTLMAICSAVRQRNSRKAVAEQHCCPN
jgi:hypothetical protein